ncbi:MAG: VWA domain-containing protein [Acidobacteriota bacterium]|nr:VWA domain-containing protein [Acidobacteriota bacterium]
MKIVLTFLLLIFSVLIVQTAAQTNETGKITKKDKKSVSVPVIISDREGHYIPGLKKEDFTVYEDDVKQDVTFLATYDEPFNIALLLDTSGSTEDVVKKIKSAAKDFIKLLNPKDKCLIATFDNQVKILSAFTSDRETLRDSLDRIKSSKLGGTLMYNALEQITQNSFASVEGRKVVVLLTDGKDFGSAVTKDELLDRFEESDVLIYSVFYKTGAIYDAAATGKKGKRSKKSRRTKKVIIPPGPIFVPTEEEMAAREKSDEAEGIDALKKMSDTTAGRFYLSDAPGLGKTFKRIAGELREQYRLGYRSKAAADKAVSRDLIIKVARPDAVVRFREKVRAQ